MQPNIRIRKESQAGDEDLLQSMIEPALPLQGLRNSIHEMLSSPADLRRMGQAAQRRVHDGLLVLGQLRS